MPLLLRPCRWHRHPWLAHLPRVPGDGIWLDDLPLGKRGEVILHLVDRIEDAIRADEWIMPRPDLRPLPREEFDLDHLPETGHLLLGRRDDWNRLDEAARAGSDVRIVVLRAQGGAGKSTLARVWVDALRDRGLPGFERAFAWSFYSQGTREQATSADLFVAEALRFFGDRGPANRDPWEKGERLAGLVAAQRTLLVLDGLEPLQAEASDHALRGAIKDPALRTLLECLARDNPGLCLVTTRERLVDLDGLAAVDDRQLDTLSPVACRALLRIAGVAGDNRELEAAAEGLGHHALAMHLLGTWLRGFVGSHIANVAKLPRLEKIEDDAAWHPRRVMEAWADRLWTRDDAAALELLGVLGLFDRPADREALVAVLQGERVHGLNGRLWRKGSAVIDPALATLRAAGLVVRARLRGQRSIGKTEGEIESHPLVREHFGERLRRLAPAAWKAGHERLYRHFAEVAEFWPATLADMEPLFRAVLHGCAAGRHEEVLGKVFVQRIRRGSEHYTLHKLGAFAAELAALAGFFAAPWQRPQPALTAPGQAWVLSAAGANLYALGRLAEAVTPMEAGLARYVEQAAWNLAAAAAGNLADLLLTLGCLGDAPAAAPGAVERAREAVAHADRSGDGFERFSERTTLADALHHQGRAAEARAIFVEAERLQSEHQPRLPQLYSLQGFRYGDLLLTLGDPAEARRRAKQTMEWMVAESHAPLLTIALDHLLLGRAALATVPDSDHPDFALAHHHLDVAVTGLRKSGHQDFIPLGHLARAALHRHAADWPAARADLAAAHRIATRGGMRLHLADHQLESARLFLATGDRDAARTAYTTARAEVDAMGYHRRDPELAALAAALDET